MKKTINFVRLNLQMFAEGATAAGGDTGTQGSTGENTEMAAASQTKGDKKNPLADVVYGKQAEENAQAADVQTQENAADDISVQEVDKHAEFDKLIKGDFKEIYDAKVQEIVKKRFSKVKDTEEKLSQLVPIMDMLSKKYGVDATDAKALMEAIEDDDAYYEEESFKTGVPVEHLKAVRKVQRENAELKKAMQEQRNREQAEKQYSTWMKQAEELKKIVPSFDFETELQNPQFISLLRSNIDVGAAYKALHFDELMPVAMQYAAQTAERKVANNIAVNGARPSENGMNARSAAVVKGDVSQLSKEDRAEVIRRVMRGEKISFS